MALFCRRERKRERERGVGGWGWGVGDGGVGGGGGGGGGVVADRQRQTDGQRDRQTGRHGDWNRQTQQDREKEQEQAGKQPIHVFAPNNVAYGSMGTQLCYLLWWHGSATLSFKCMVCVDGIWTIYDDAITWERFRWQWKRIIDCFGVDHTGKWYWVFMFSF